MADTRGELVSCLPLNMSNTGEVTGQARAEGDINIHYYPGVCSDDKEELILTIQCLLSQDGALQNVNIIVVPLCCSPYLSLTKLFTLQRSESSTTGCLP